MHAVPIDLRKGPQWIRSEEEIENKERQRYERGIVRQDACRVEDRVMFLSFGSVKIPDLDGGRKFVPDLLCGPLVIRQICSRDLIVQPSPPLFPNDPGFQPNQPTVEPPEPNNGQSTFYELHPHTE
jgi:hypothetical protein